MTASRALRLLAIVAILAAIGYGLWTRLRPADLPDGFASGNGRIEATEINVAAKIAGRVAELLVREGEFVTTGQELARMDTAVLRAQFAEATANWQRAQISVETAGFAVKQQEAQQQAATALVAQRQAELDSAEKNLSRAKELASSGSGSIQRLDDTTAAFQGSKAALAAAEAQVAAANAAISNARAEIVSARAAVEASKATMERIKADIDDSTLRAPRDGRVQYLVAHPGEVVSAGGVVLDLVDLSDVYMTFFLPTRQAGRVALAAEGRIVLDAVPQYVIPAEISFVADVAQFTPKTVETEEEREKLMFRIKARIKPELLKEYMKYVKTGLPGTAYVRLDQNAAWPARLNVSLPK
ncbi:HlyD family secretion protein [Chelatococcus reniformis]|uniref:Multidrug resistance protein MdtA-like barrel-sandwich hybrid domain-containing protein n=1 Tax=Chelatococcus reniformis TaxID=1494448 RepID=A0A916TZH6_9HYPH|nr:HlyD family efflux transporter periplasmic adaptor subunit [Chelatococcus reniformis]GGC52669.1 hypothetical protein GCM10010994_09680 [Chelatococcus reniformis]